MFRWFITIRASCGFLGVTMVVAALVLAGSAVAEPAACRDSAYLTWRPSDGEGHRLSVVDATSGELTDVAELPFRINAIGYYEPDDRMYGLARPDPAQWERSAPPHLVAMASDGAVEDLGELRGLDEPVPGLAGAYSGAIHDGRLVVLASHELVFIDLTDRRGHVTERITIAESADTLNIGDFDSDGAHLYGVDTKTESIVRIAPESGTVTRIPVTGLPNRSLAGAAFITPDTRLHAVLNGIDGQAVLYRMDPTAEVPHAVEYGRLPAVSSADAAACRASGPAPPPGHPSVTPPPSAAPPQSPTPSASVAPPNGPTPTGPGTSDPTPGSPHSTPGPGSTPAPTSGTSSTESPGAGSGPEAVSPTEPPAGHSPAVFPDRGHVTVGHEADEPPRRWIAVGIVILAVVGSAGVKATAKRSK